MRKNLSTLARLAELLDDDLYCPACDSTRLQWKAAESELSLITGEIIVPGRCKNCKMSVTARFQLSEPDVSLED